MRQYNFVERQINNLMDQYNIILYMLRAKYEIEHDTQCSIFEGKVRIILHCPCIVGKLYGHCRLNIENIKIKYNFLLDIRSHLARFTSGIFILTFS